MRKPTSLWAAVSIVILLSIGVMALATEPAIAQSSTPQPLTIAPPPYDAFEPVTGQPQVIEALEARRAVEALLRSAFEKRATPAGGAPYTVRISFIASGETQEVGPGEMEETRNAAGVRRWTGHLGKYSLTRIIT